MKKVPAFLLVVALLFSMLSLAGCGNNGEQQDMGKIEFKQFTNDDVVFENDELFVKNQLLITADEKYSYADVEKAVGKYDGKIVGCIEFTNDYQVEFENADYDKLTEIKNDLSNELSDSEIILHNAFSVDSNSENYEKDFSSNEGNWWRDAIQLTNLESKQYDYKTVKVGVYDILFDTDNPDLAYAMDTNRIWNNDTSKINILDDGNHGTNVSGFLAAQKKNERGIDGVANNVELYGYACKGKDTSFSSIMSIKINYSKMIQKGVKIINNCVGHDDLFVAAQHGITAAVDALDFFSKSLSMFLRKYIDKGYEFIIVDAAGNLNSADIMSKSNKNNWIECDSSEDHPYGIKQYNFFEDGLSNKHSFFDSIMYTADYNHFGAITDEKVRNRIIEVGSSTKSNARAEHSVNGQRVDIYAPGKSITELATGNNGNGTSYATPIVSGVIALMWGINPTLSADRIKFLLTSSATQPISNERYQISPDSGDVVYAHKYLVNADNAVERARNIKDPLVVPLNDDGVLVGCVKKVNENGEAKKLNSICEISIYAGTKDDAFNTLTDSDYKEPVARLFETDAFGVFDIDLPEGDYYLSASYNNGEYQSVIKTFRINKGEVCYLDDIIITKTIQHYTAMDLIDKSLAEIVKLMGNDYQLNKQRFSTAFGSDPVLMIYNETTMSGLAVCPSYSSGIYKDIENGVNVRDKIQQGNYTYDGIAVFGSGKLNETISADMTYNQIAEQIGEFDCRGVGQGTLVCSTEINGVRVSFFFTSYDNPDLSARIKNNTASSADMKSVNPKIESIAVFRNKDINNTNSSSNVGWKNAYVNYVNSEYSKLKIGGFIKPEYALILLDNDNVPELIWYNKKSYGGNDHLVWFANGEICQEEYCKVSYYEEKNNLFWGDWHRTLHSSQRHLGSLKNGKFQWLYIEVSGASDSTGRNPYSTIENETIDRATYEETAERLKGNGKEPNYVSKDEIIKQIEQY